jgi:AcrR family transcriptional regulator
MSHKNKSTNQNKQSFIEIARRSQIIECAIEVIATMGYSRASLAQIAKQAGISKGVISYHFSSKDEIMEQIILDLYNKGASFTKPYIEAENTATGVLRAYIESNMEFMRTHSNQVITVTEIINNARKDEGKIFTELINTEAILDYLVQLLLTGSRKGEFREFNDFSARVMATTIRTTIDGLSFQLKNPHLNFVAYTNELINIFDLATRKV